MLVTRQGRQPRVFHRPADSKMVQALKLITAPAEDLVEGVVKIEADARATEALNDVPCIVLIVSGGALTVFPRLLQRIEDSPSNKQTGGSDSEIAGEKRGRECFL